MFILLISIGFIGIVLAIAFVVLECYNLYKANKEFKKYHADLWKTFKGKKK